MDRAFLFYVPPRLSEKSRREQKSLYPHYRGDNGFSILTGGTFTFKTVSLTPDCLKSLGESRKVCTPLQGDNGFSILTEGTFTFKTVSPTTSVCKGVFRAHLRCLQLTGTVIGPVSA